MTLAYGVQGQAPTNSSVQLISPLHLAHPIPTLRSVPRPAKLTVPSSVNTVSP